jgi:hypothetical protein
MPAQLLVIAGALRALFQLFPDMFTAAGAARLTFRLGVLSLVVLGSCLGVALLAIGVERAAIAMAMGWLGVYPILLPVALWLGASSFDLRPKEYWLKLVAPMFSALVTAVLGLRLRALLAADIPLWARIAIVSLAVVATYALVQVVVGRATTRVAIRDETDGES